VSFRLDPERAAHADRKNARRIIGMATSAAFVLTAALLFLAASAPAAPPTLGWGTEVNPGQCETSGSPIVNVNYKVINSVDSGTAGNYWAFTDYSKRVQLWQQGDDAYCAVVSYQGHFAGEEGQRSPGDTESLDGDEDGTFQGGYRATITGELLADPTWPARGHVGVIDHGCDISGACPGRDNWVEEYFGPGYGFEYAWWGWIYHGARHGTWVNSSDGNAGDIT
jgi:hypothetical protein